MRFEEPSKFGKGGVCGTKVWQAGASSSQGLAGGVSLNGEAAARRRQDRSSGPSM